MTVIAAAAAAVATPAATDVLINEDLRCLAVFASLADGKDKENDAGMTGAIMYYIGRIDARVPDYQFGPALKTLFAEPTWNDAAFAADAQRCGAEMGKRGDELSAIGDAMSAEAGKPAN